MLEDQIGPMFLGVLSLLFASYGVRELSLAYRLKSFEEWLGKAFIGTNGLLLGALFACCTYRLVGGATLLKTVFAKILQYTGNPMG